MTVIFKLKENEDFYLKLKKDIDFLIKKKKTNPSSYEPRFYIG